MAYCNVMKNITFYNDMYISYLQYMSYILNKVYYIVLYYIIYYIILYYTILYDIILYYNMILLDGIVLYNILLNYIIKIKNIRN